MSEIKEWFPGKKVPSDKRPFVSKLSPRKSSGMSCPGALKSTRSSLSLWLEPRSSGDKAAIPTNPAQLSRNRRRSGIFLSLQETRSALGKLGRSDQPKDRA